MAKDIIPNGIQWADGANGNPGTPTPSKCYKFKNANPHVTDIAEISIEEEPGSPVIERAEQCTITHSFAGSYSDLSQRLATLGRGTILYDDEGDITSKILTARVTRTKGNLAKLEVVAEAVSFDNPPDEFSIVPTELGINIMKHPRYFYALNGTITDDPTQYEAYIKNQAVIRELQNYFETVNVQARNSIIERLSNSIGVYDASGTALISGTDIAKRAALEIAEKYWLGIETPYIAGFEINWSSYFWRPQFLNPGGYREDPIFEANPGLPEYFWNTSDLSATSSAYTIFDKLPILNPTCYSSDGKTNGAFSLSWLRKTDHQDFQRTWFKLTRTWIGSPVGLWDTELYTHLPRPTVAADYNVVNGDPIPTIDLFD